MSNAPQTGQFYGVDALARQPDASVIIVDQNFRPDVDVLFPNLAVIGVKGSPKPHDGLKGRAVWVWTVDPDKLLEPLTHVAAKIGVVRGVQSPCAFLGNPAAVKAHMMANVEKYWARPVIVAPAPVQEVADAPAALDVDEHSLADAFSRRNPHVRYVSAWGKWLEWNGHQWKQDDTLRAYDLARAVCIDSAPMAGDSVSLKRKVKSAATRAAVVNLAQSDRRHAAIVDQWDKDIWMLNTPAGMVDLRTGVMREARIDDYATKSTSVSPTGDCPLWREFVRQICDFDDDLCGFLQRVIGYSLTGDTREQCLFFFYGTGANGKGTFLNTLRDVFSDYATVAGMDVFTESKHDRHPQELARLRGARLVCAQETEQGKRWAEARIKALTGGDPITAHFMRQDDFEFIPQFKLIIAGNHKPALRNIDEAMRRRLHMVPFTVTIPPDKRDKDLGAKLRSEAAAILKWAIDGCLAWQKFGLQPPESVLTATNEYLNSQDVFGLWIDECTLRKPEKTKSSALHKSYKRWCEEKGEYSMRSSDFINMLEGRGFNRCMLNGLNHIAGLALNHDEAHSENSLEF